MIQDHFYASGVSEKTVTKTNWFGQTFIPANSFALTGVALCLRRSATWSGSENFTVSVFATSAGLPDGVALGSKSVLGVSVSGSGLTPGYPVQFQFDTPIDVVAGTTYALTMSHASVSGGMVSVYNSSGGYANGNYIYSTNSGGSWSAQLGWDFWFELWDNDVAELSNNVGLGGNTFAEGSTTTQWVAQWFNLSPDAIACGVVRLCGIATESSGDITVELRDGDPSTTNPGNIVYGTAIVSKSELASTIRNWFSAVFSPAVNLQPSTYYNIVCSTSSGTFTCLVSTFGTHALTADSGVTWTRPAKNLQYQVIRTGDATVPPVITNQSSDTVAAIGSIIQFFVTATGDPDPTYQWYKDGDQIVGETNNTIDITVASSSGGSYTCIATNVAGSDTSDPIILSVYPEISAQSGDKTVPNGSILTIFVTAVGYPTLSYQWYKNGSIIAGATLASYVFYPSFAMAGVYACIVTNTAGHADSNPIVVTVVPNPYNYNLSNVPTDLSRETP